MKARVTREIVEYVEGDFRTFNLNQIETALRLLVKHDSIFAKDIKMNALMTLDRLNFKTHHNVR
jgi:hypothetical protein